MSNLFIPLLLGAGLVAGRSMIRRQRAGGLLWVVLCAALALTFSLWRCSKPASPLLRTGLDNAALLHQAEGEAMGDWLAEHYPGANAVILIDKSARENIGIQALRNRLGRECALHLLHVPELKEDDLDPVLPKDVHAEIRQQMTGREVAVITAHHMAAQRVWRSLPNGERPALCFMFVDPILLPGLFQQRVLTAATNYHATPEEQAAIRNDPRHTPEQARRLIRVLTPESVFDAVTW
jgi:hypothetical protein